MLPKAMNKNKITETKQNFNPGLMLIGLSGTGPSSIRMLLKRGIREKQGKLENEKRKQNRELEMKLLIGLKCMLRFVPIFHFSAPLSSF